MRILIADDNASIRSILQEYAVAEGYEVILVASGEEALEAFSHYQPDIVLLDVMMPGIDGFEVCKTIRQTSRTPVIMVTAKGEDYERIMGLDVGADDYVVKPFSPAEVMARIRAVLRRIELSPQETNRLDLENLHIRMDAYVVKVDSTNVALSKKEIELLWLLATHVGRVYERMQLLELLWGYDYDGDIRTVDTHIKRLRAKLDNYPHPNWDIKTVWGVGYKFEQVQTS